jgi:hypothetical protein
MRTAIAAVALVVLLPVGAAAQDPVQTFGQLDTRLRIGDRIWLSDTQGREIKGKVRELSQGSVRVDANGTVQEFQVERVGTIRVEQKDGLMNGVLWGAAAGFGLGALSCAANSQCIGDESGPHITAVLGLLGAAAGAGIGAAIDAATNGKLVIYEAPRSRSRARLSVAPVLTARQKGVAMSFSF